MKVQFRASFAKDLRSIKDQSVLERVGSLIEQIERAKTLEEIPNMKKLAGGKSYFRLRVGSYRLGLAAEGDTVTLIRFLDRKEIYRYFP